MDTSPPVEQIEADVYRVTGYAEALAALSDRRLSNDPLVAGRLHPALDPTSFRAGKSGTMQTTDPPHHIRLRAVVAPWLAPRRLQKSLQQTEIGARELLSGLLERGHGDLITGFVAPLIAASTARMLGAPEQDHDRLAAWTEASTMPDPATAKAGDAALRNYFIELIDTKQEGPDDCLCTALTTSLAKGDITDSDAVGIARIMMVAGYETSVGFLGMCSLTLALAPGLRSVLLDQGAHLPRAVEELLRFVTPTQEAWARFATADVVLGDTLVPAGSMVLVDLLGANRDPREFAAPHILDPTRDGAHHLSFGHGAHFCPGATLARRQAHVILRILLPQLENLTLARSIDEIVWHQTRFSRRPRSLPVVRSDGDMGGSGFLS